MKIDFNNNWYREQCLENGLDPDNVLSQTSIEVAKAYAIKLKYWLDARELAKEQYLQEWEELEPKFETQIERCNSARIGHMLDALDYAEIAGKWEPGFNEHLKRIYERHQHLLRKR